MSALKLVKLTAQYQRHLVEMLEEWRAYNATHDANRSPWAIFKNDCHDFDTYLSQLEHKTESEGHVPDSVFFALDEERDIFVGAVNIRHCLNEKLLRSGGHIGDGIRPSERGKGFGTRMMALALEECRKLGLKKVLVVCDKDNVASAKTIIRNGGVLENEELDEGEVIQRYWIDLSAD